MYELDGQDYSLEEVSKAAEESNLTVEQYLQQTGIVKGTPVETDATAGEEIAFDTDSSSEVGSSESAEVKVEEPKSFLGLTKESFGFNKKNEPIGNDDDWEDYNGINETAKKLEQSVESTVAGARIIPSFIDEMGLAVTKTIVKVGNSLFDSDTLKKIQVGFDAFDTLDYKNQQKFLNTVMDLAPVGSNRTSAFENYEKVYQQGEELQKELTQFDNSIGETFAQGNVTEGLARTFSSVIESIPFMVEAMIPVVGIPLIVAQEAARASKEAQREGDEIDLTLIGYSAVIGASEGLLELVTKGIAGKMFKGLVGAPKEIIKKSLSQMVLATGKSMGAEGLSEGATLTINNAAEMFIRGDEKAFEGYVSELIDTVIIGAASGGSMSSAGQGFQIVRNQIEAKKVNKELKASKHKNLADAFTSSKEDDGSLKLAENENTQKFLNYELKQKVDSGEITIEESDNIKNNFSETQGAINRLKPLGLTGDAQIKAVELLKEKIVLQKTIDTVKEGAAVENETEQIKVIDEKLREISKENAAFKRGKDVGTTKEFAEGLGLELVENKSVDDLTKIAPKGFNAKTDYGFIQGDKIYLNNSIIGKTNEVKTASHELLHGILTKSILDGDMTKETVEKFVKDSFGQKGFESIKQQMEDIGYDSAYLEKRPDEYLTQLYESDMLGEAGSFEKVARFVEGIILKITGQQFNFTNKNDLGLFLREYKSSVESGTLSKKLKDSKFFNTDKDGKLITSKEGDITALSLSKKDSNTVNDIYADQGLNQNSEQQILKLLKPTAKGLAQRFRDRPSFDQKLVEDQILTGKRGMLEVVKSYPAYVAKQKAAGNTVAPLSGFINNAFSTKKGFKRYIDSAETVVTKEFTQDISTAKGVTDTTTETTTEKISEKSNKPKKPRVSLRQKIKITPDVKAQIEDAVIKTFGTRLPPANSPKFKKALIKSYKTLLFKDIKNMMGTRGEFENFLRDNFETIYDAIPQSVINKRFPGFLKTVVDKDGKQIREATAVGKGVFEKNKIVKAQFISYFLGRNVKDSTKGTRKDALAETLAVEFAKDATPQTVKRADVIARMELANPTVTQEKISEAVSRPADFAFSKAVDKVLKLKTDTQKDEIRFTLENAITNKEIKNYTNVDGKVNFSALINKIFSNDKLLTKSQRDKISEEYQKEYDRLPDDVKQVNKPSFEFDGNKYTLTDFLTSKILSKIGATDSYKKVIQALVNKDFDGVDLTPAFVKNTQNTIGNIVKNIGWSKQELQRYLGRGLKAPAKIGNGDLIYKNGKIVFKKQPLKRNKKGKLVSPTNRFGLFPNSKAVDSWINSLGLKNDPNFNDNYVSNISIPYSSGKPYTAAQRAKIISAGQSDNKAFRQLIEGLRKSYQKNEISPDGIMAILMSMNNNPAGLTRTSAILDFIPLENISGKIVLEHMTPALVVNLAALDYILNKKSSKDFNNIMDNYRTAYLPEAFDKVINKYYKDYMPFYWDPSKPSIIRYQNPETKEVFTLPLVQLSTGLVLDNNYSDNKQIQEDFNKNFKKALSYVPTISDGVNNVALSKAKAGNLNNNILPTNKKLKDGFTNEQVLDEMKSLDDKANEARSAFSKGKNLNKDFNDILEQTTGIASEKQYGRTKASAVGADKGRFDLLGIPPSAQDFVGLTRYFAGKGKKGDATIAWIKENFLDPFARANIDISNARVALANDFKGLKKLLGVSPKDLNKKITGEPYTVGNAVRVYTWLQQGMNVPGLSNADAKILNDYVSADANLVTFANELISINKDNGYPKPQDGWLAGTITTDLLSGLNTVVRAKYLNQWQENVDKVFTETNLNKLEAAYGKGYRDALENILGRMKTGSNRGFKGDSLTGRFIDWINGSVGAIMFFNMKSAVLQTISAVNFVNWSDNNPLKAAAAFGNQPQYWGDVVTLMNSDYLVERRNGLKINVNEADIAEIAAESKNKAKAFISKILKLGFLPTQIADSFAIASGGATFYRNRVNSLLKEGMTQKEAEAQAFQDFREISEESQQSSRPDRISKQQAGPLGRVILAFANTPAQYARLMQKAASDLKNRRGDDKTNISKIMYYGAVQNVIFNALQQALFAMAFDDEEADEETKNKKYTEIANGMADSLLRGLGFHGAAISTLKNVIMKLASGSEAQDAAIELLDISPPISSKIGKLKSAGRTWDWNKKEIREKGWSLDNPAWLASGQVVSAATNIPLDRGIRKLQNLKDASDTENEEWQRVANALGWSKWQLDWEKDKPKKKKKKKRLGKTLGKSFGKKMKI